MRSNESANTTHLEYSSVNLASREFKADPFPFYARLRAEQPVCRVTVPLMPGINEAWLVTRYDDVVAVLKDSRFAKSRVHASKKPWLPGFAKPLERNMLDLDEPDHTRLRTLVHKAFTPAMVERLQERIQEIADQLIDAVQHKGSMELGRAYAVLVPLTVIMELLGIPSRDRDRFHRWSKAALRTPTPFNILRSLPAMWAFMHYLRRLFSQLRRSPQNGLLTALVQVEESGDRLSEDELLAMAILLLIAGHETTVNLISSGTLALLQHPDQLQLLRTDALLIKSAVEELLRYTNPLETATARYAREDVTLAGVTVPCGSLVLAVIASANRDEAQFDHPEHLDITREENRHVAFGQGAHFCLHRWRGWKAKSLSTRCYAGCRTYSLPCQWNLCAGVQLQFYADWRRCPYGFRDVNYQQLDVEPHCAGIVSRLPNIPALDPLHTDEWRNQASDVEPRRPWPPTPPTETANCCTGFTSAASLRTFA